MGETYKQISQAKNDAARVKLLAGILHADEKNFARRCTLFPR